MSSSDFIVAVGREEQYTGTLNAPPNEAQEIERGLIRPVHILQHHHTDPLRAREFRHQSCEQPVARIVATPVRSARI